MEEKMPSQLEESFHAAMLNVYQCAGRLNSPYRPTRFLSMVRTRGGKEAADQLLGTNSPSDGFTELFLRGRESLKLSVEYLVLQDPWNTLFTNNQRAEASRRLIGVGALPTANTVNSYAE